MPAHAPLPAAARHPCRAELPAQIGKYSVRAKLGEGAASEVFLAHDAFHNRDVAIKRVRLGLAADTPEGHFQQHFFAAEAALVGRLRHPNVVQVYAVEEQPLPLPGDGVRPRRIPPAIRSDGLVTRRGAANRPADRRGVGRRQGLIHRDIKPANILPGERVSASRSPTSAVS